MMKKHWRNHKKGIPLKYLKYNLISYRLYHFTGDLSKVIQKVPVVPSTNQSTYHFNWEVQNIPIIGTSENKSSIFHVTLYVRINISYLHIQQMQYVHIYIRFLPLYVTTSKWDRECSLVPRCPHTLNKIINLHFKNNIFFKLTYDQK